MYSHRGCKFCGETLFHFFFFGFFLLEWKFKSSKSDDAWSSAWDKNRRPAGDWLVRQLVILNSKCGIKWTCSICLGVKSLNETFYTQHNPMLHRTHRTQQSNRIVCSLNMIQSARLHCSILLRWIVLSSYFYASFVFKISVDNNNSHVSKKRFWCDCFVNWPLCALTVVLLA